jgi:hypothetical protein
VPRFVAGEEMVREKVKEMAIPYLPGSPARKNGEMTV